MSTLILPCAGKSSRFKETTPKFLIKNPLKENLIMVVCSVLGLPLTDFDEIYIVIRQDHEDKYNASELIINDFKKIGIENIQISIIENSESAADTVCQCISINEISDNIYIKDCDDYFTISNLAINAVWTVSLNDCGKIHASNKSYVSKNDNGLIMNIVEKQVISADFCCGLYSFAQSKKFVEAYNGLSQFSDSSEIYISHVIFKLILQGDSFNNRKAKNFIDWGTQEDWDDYLRKGHAGIL